VSLCGTERHKVQYSKVEEICCGLLEVSVSGFASDGGVRAGTAGVEPGVFRLRVALSLNLLCSLMQ
jgi:hypothetical protein